MKQIARRDRLKIYGDLLSVLSNVNREEKIVLTHVQVQIGVPFDRLKTYISELHNLGLIEDQTSFKLTEKGKQYIVEYGKVLDFMKRMGLTYR
jgi:predicted transcriptional regulator